MKVFALHDETNEQAGVLAYLECHERPQSFYFELPPEADAWALPFILHEFAQRGQLTIGDAWARCWVESRIVPPERQNLGEILRENGLSDYDEQRLLELTQGRCSQDGCYLMPATEDQLPPWYQKRRQKRLADAYALDGCRVLAIFRSGEARVCPLKKALQGRRAYARLLADEQTFMRMQLLADGHGVGWGTKLALSANELRELGRALPLDASDIECLVRQASCDTAETAELLGCTRQNISDLVRRGKLTPLKAGGKSALFLRADVLARR